MKASIFIKDESVTSMLKLNLTLINLQSTLTRTLRNN